MRGGKGVRCVGGEREREKKKLVGILRDKMFFDFIFYFDYNF